MRVLVTGGAGFIGSHLAEALLLEGHMVTAIDDLSTGRIKNIAKIRSNKRFKFIKGTILDEKLMQKLVRDADFIYHLAAAVGVKYIIENTLSSIQTNVRGTEIVLELADRFSTSKKRKKVLITSTSEVYGKNENIPFSEEDDRVLGSTTICRWSYSCAKSLDEFLAFAYSKEKKLPIVIVRFFNTCGPRQIGDYGMVVPRFVDQALSGEPLTVFGSGKQTRSFLHVGDAVRAVLLLSKNKKALGKVFNIGSTQRITIGDLAKKVIKLTKSNSKITHIPYSKIYKNHFEDMIHRLPDIKRLKKICGFKLKYDLDNIINEMISERRAK